MKYQRYGANQKARILAELIKFFETEKDLVSRFAHPVREGAKRAIEADYEYQKKSGDKNPKRKSIQQLGLWYLEMEREPSQTVKKAVRKLLKS